MSGVMAALASFSSPAVLITAGPASRAAARPASSERPFAPLTTFPRPVRCKISCATLSLLAKASGWSFALTSTEAFAAPFGAIAQTAAPVVASSGR
jgi:hypothetical protein